MILWNQHLVSQKLSQIGSIQGGQNNHKMQISPGNLQILCKKQFTSNLQD